MDCGVLGWRLFKEEAAVLQGGNEARCRGEASDAIADPTGCDDAVLQGGKETRCRGEASDAIADPTGCDDAVLEAWQMEGESGVRNGESVEEIPKRGLILVAVKKGWIGGLDCRRSETSNGCQEASRGGITT